MINPKMLVPRYVKKFSPRFGGGKTYIAFIGKPLGRYPFRRASEALAYAERIHARWCRLYDAAILAEMQSQKLGEGAA